MLEMPNNPNTATTNPTTDPASLCNTDHNRPKIKIQQPDQLTVPVRVIDVTAPRNVLNKIEKSIRLYASRIDQLATELRKLVDNLGDSIVTASPAATSTVAHIVECVAEYTGIGENSIRSVRQDRATVRARHISFYLASELTSLSLPKLGEYFGRDHTTILHGITKMRRLLPASAKLRADIEAITATIEGRT